MKLSLSTNWCNRRIESGEEIAEKAMELGFAELELGYNTSVTQVPGFKRMLDQIPVGSIHSFCPVPISAPCGYPELYSLATLDEDARAIAKFQIVRNIEFAADMGAASVVLHAGRVGLGSILARNFGSYSLREQLRKANGDLNDKRYQKLLDKAFERRTKRGAPILEAFVKTLEELSPVLEKNSVTLALENMPYFEGFPNEDEMAEIFKRLAGAPVRAWFDTGHHRVREMHGWLPKGWKMPAADAQFYRGMHVNDVIDYDDNHFAPGGGKVDFAALSALAHSVRNVVFEPSAAVSEEELKAGVSNFLRAVGE